MPPRCSTRGSPTGSRIPALFSGAMDNSGAANPNRRGRLPSSGAGTPGARARRRLALGAVAHPIDLMMDPALGRPALVVVADAPTSMTGLMRMVPTMTSTRRHFSTLSPTLSLCLSNLARI